MGKPLIIFDTDMDTDCDDAGALFMLIRAHMAEQIDLLGVVADSISAHAAPFCKEVLSYCGVEKPVGEVYGHVPVGEIFDAYLRHQELCNGQAYNKALAKRQDDFYSSDELYLELLRGAEDKSVTVLCVGMLTAVVGAIKADKALFQKKVKRVVMMGNPYKQNDFNLSMDKESTREFFELCPSPVYISYLGGEIITGDFINRDLEKGHPVRRAYEIWCGQGGRSSWDLVAALFAMEQHTDLFCTEQEGAVAFDPESKRATVGAGTGHFVLGLNCQNDEMKRILNSMLK